MHGKAPSIPSYVISFNSTINIVLLLLLLLLFSSPFFFLFSSSHINFPNTLHLQLTNALWAYIYPYSSSSSSPPPPPPPLLPPPLFLLFLFFPLRTLKMISEFFF